MIRFLAPHWFLLVPVLVVAGWQWRALGLTRPLRALCLALVVLLLAEPQIRRQGDGLDVWLLVDRSDSATEALEPRLTATKVPVYNSGRTAFTHIRQRLAAAG